jgi:oligopeptide transport system substrate-binding protein
MTRYPLLSAAVLLLAACGAPDGSPDATAGGQPGLFRLNLSAEVSSLDPAFADNQANIWAVVQLYNGLLRLGDDLSLEPDLARSWDVSPDGLRYTFHLRTDARFHDDAAFGGRERKVVAGDAVYSFRRLLDPALGADGFWVFHDVVDPREGFAAPDDSTLVITLREPFRPFLSRLAMPYCAIVPREAVEAYGAEFRNHPVGTGPFRLVAWEEGERLQLGRHDGYFRRDAEGRPLPYLEAVRFSFQSAKGTEFLRFRNGELDFVSDLDAESLDRVLDESGGLRPEFAEGMTLLRGPYYNTEYLGINLEAAAAQGSPLADARVRRALHLAIDRERMLTYQRNGKGLPARGFTPPALTGEDPGRGQVADPDRAAALLAEAGYPGGRDMPELVLRTNEQYLDLCAFLAHQWGEIGVPVRLETMDGKVLRETMVKGQSVFFRASWIADYPDAESFLTVFRGGVGAPPNYTRFADPAFDAWYAEAVREGDEARRQALYRRMDSLVMASAPVLPLYYDEVLLLTRPWVSGLRPNPLNLLRLETVRTGGVGGNGAEG